MDNDTSTALIGSTQGAVIALAWIVGGWRLALAFFIGLILGNILLSLPSLIRHFYRSG